MNIALFGYGKMGKKLEEIGQSRGHSIEAILELDTPKTKGILQNVDVAIDFSTPKAAFENLEFCFQNQVPVVCGTTGWLARKEEAEQLCLHHDSGFLYASNFSLGVNLFFELNQKLAEMMALHMDYDIAIEEIHHTQKLDAPSGTAITLAEGIIKHTSYENWSLENEGEKSISITAKREGQVPGTHTIKYNSVVDSIEIKHTAHSRDGFALGAIIAAEWLKGKKGIYNMKNVLNLQ